MYSVPLLATVNAALNAIAAAFLAAGFYFIRRRQIAAHRACMLTAFGVSVIFLVCYLAYHYQVGDVRFQGHGAVRPFYFSILISHIILAALTVPLAVFTLARALRAPSANSQMDLAGMDVRLDYRRDRVLNGLSYLRAADYSLDGICHPRHQANAGSVSTSDCNAPNGAATQDIWSFDFPSWPWPRPPSHSVFVSRALCGAIETPGYIQPAAARDFPTPQSGTDSAPSGRGRDSVAVRARGG